MHRADFVCRIEVCVNCGGAAEHLCDEPLPHYIVEQGLLSGLRFKLYALYDRDIREATQSERALIDRQITGLHDEWTRRLRDAPPEAKTCSIPVCGDCALDLGDDRHLCHIHAERHVEQERRADEGRKALLDRGFGVLPADGWIRWRGKAHLMPHAESLSLACGRAVIPGWRAACGAERCAACKARMPRG